MINANVNPSEHREWLLRRIRRNQRFRNQCADWAIVPLEEKREFAARLVGRTGARAA